MKCFVTFVFTIITATFSLNPALAATSTRASINNFTLTLVDLDQMDNITPELTWLNHSVTPPFDGGSYVSGAIFSYKSTGPVIDDQ